MNLKNIGMKHNQRGIKKKNNDKHILLFFISKKIM